MDRANADHDQVETKKITMDKIKSLVFHELLGKMISPRFRMSGVSLALLSLGPRRSLARSSARSLGRSKSLSVTSQLTAGAGLTEPRTPGDQAEPYRNVTLPSLA